MRKKFSKPLALTLVLVTVCMAFGACTMASVTDTTVLPAANETITCARITIEADGREITFEDAEGKTVQDLLDEAEIELFEGDVISIEADQTPTGDMTLRLLRRCAITVSVDGEQYTAILVGGTVADALEALDIELSEDQVSNFDLDAALENEMEIVIEEKVEEVEEVEEEDDDDDSSSNSFSGSSNRPSSGSSSNRPSSGGNSGSGSSGSGSTATPTPAPTPQPTPSRTVVSVQIYEDCDGSGHGVKVITYSDGSQEEIPF